MEWYKWMNKPFMIFGVIAIINIDQTFTNPAQWVALFCVGGLYVCGALGNE